MTRQVATSGPNPGRRHLLAAALLLAVVLLTAGCVASGAGPATATSAAGPAAEALDLHGDLHTHDPALVAGTGKQPWYVFSTGDVHVGLGAPQVRRSTDGGRTWTYVGTVWDAATRPQWVYQRVKGVQNFWAPEVVEHDGTYYLYYAASTFGSNTSVIGLTTNTTLDPADPAYHWVDRGEVWHSTAGQSSDNAIDPGVVTDASGTPWMAYGSFWSGIRLLQLQWPSGKPAPGASPTTIASRLGPPDAIEAGYLVHRGRWYYLFVSRDSCCRGTASTYNIAVARSTDVRGPYIGRTGTPATLDGATPLLGTTGTMVGPGGQSYSNGYLAFHYYDATAGGDFRLAIRKLAWTDDGWPVATTAAEQAGTAASAGPSPRP